MTTRRQFVRHFVLMTLLGASALGCALFAGFGPGVGTSRAAQRLLDGESKLPRQVLIIRHAEKTDEPNDVDLSVRGNERAQRLPELFVKSVQRPMPFARPDFIFATRNSDESHRPVETVTPLSVKLPIPIDDRYKNKTTTEHNHGIQDLALEILHNPKYAGKTVLVCWHQGTIPELARALQADEAPENWHAKVFDRVWQIVYDDQGKAEFSALPQRLLPGDSQQ